MRPCGLSAIAATEEDGRRSSPVLGQSDLCWYRPSKIEIDPANKAAPLWFLPPGRHQAFPFHRRILTKPEEVPATRDRCLAQLPLEPPSGNKIDAWCGAVPGALENPGAVAQQSSSGMPLGDVDRRPSVWRSLRMLPSLHAPVADQVVVVCA